MGKIGVFDSGIGGLTVIREIQKKLPKMDILFYEDSLNIPYGNKSDKELFKITENIVEYLINNDCKLIVIACNTATTRCIKYLREKYPDIIFVGTEPAIKVACDGLYQNILVLATPATVVSERTNFLIDQNKREFENIYLVPCDGLAAAIEKSDVDSQKMIIEKVYKEYKDKNIDAVVLGCTHYPLIRELIGEYFQNSVLLDGSLGVAKNCKRLLENNNLLSDGEGKLTVVNSLEL